VLLLRKNREAYKMPINQNKKHTLCRKVSLLLCFILTAGQLTGCSDKKNSSSGNSPAPASSEAVTTASEEDTTEEKTSSDTSSSKTTSKTTTQTTTTTTATTTTTYAVTVPPEAVTYADPDINDSIRNCLNMLLSSEENLLEARYMLTDVNSDGTPEILFRYDIGDWYDAFFIYRDGRYEKCDFKAISIYTCTPKNIIGTHFYDGNTIDAKYILGKDNELERIYYYNDETGEEQGILAPEEFYIDEYGNQIYYYNDYQYRSFQTCENWDTPDFTSIYKKE
jgi:hypothetical protein